MILKRLRCFVLIVTCFLIAGCDFLEPEESKPPPVTVNFVSADPPNGSTIKPDETITVTFDDFPGQVAVTQGAVGIADRIATISGPFEEGPLSLTITWADSAQRLTYTVEEPPPARPPPARVESPHSIAETFLTLIWADGKEHTWLFRHKTTPDRAGSDIPYTYRKTGVNTARIAIHNSRVYNNLGDTIIQLTFTSTSAGTFELRPGDFVDPVTGAVEKGIPNSGRFTLR